MSWFETIGKIEVMRIVAYVFAALTVLVVVFVAWLKPKLIERKLKRKLKG